MRKGRVDIKNIYWKNLNKKQKIDYYFQYYFSWTVAAVIVLMFISFYAYQVISKVSPDLYMITIGSYIPDEKIEKALTEEIKEYLEDVNDDGEKYIDFNTILHDPESKETETGYANEQKYMSLLGEGHSRLLLMDKDHYEASLLDEQFDGFLTDLSQYVSGTYLNYALPVSETVLYGNSETSMFDDYYLVLTEIGGDKKESGINLDRYNAGIKLIEAIKK